MPPVIPDPLPPADSPETCVAIMAATPDSERTHVTRGQGGHLDTETGRPPPCLPGVGEDGQRVTRWPARYSASMSSSLSLDVGIHSLSNPVNHRVRGFHG